MAAQGTISITYINSEPIFEKKKLTSRTSIHQTDGEVATEWLLIESMHSAHASEAKLSALADDSSASDGFDSCFAAAWRTRSWTAVVEGDVARPILLGSSFLAAQDNASAPTLTGENKSLHKERERGDNIFETAPDLQAEWNGCPPTKHRCYQPGELTLGLAENPRNPHMRRTARR
jgi:hypothetical protein